MKTELLICPDHFKVCEHNRWTKRSLDDSLELLCLKTRLHPKTTLRSVLKILQHHAEFYQKMLNVDFLTELCEHVKNVKHRQKTSLEKLTLHWNVESWDIKGDDSFYMWLALSGVDKKIKHDTLSVELSPVEELLDVPLELDEKVTVHKLKTMRDTESDYLGVTAPRLLDILMTVAYELTFHGTEVDKRELLKSLMNTDEEIESEKTLSTTEVKKRLRRQKRC